MSQVPKVILGISYGHGDSSAALIVEGRLVAAAEEERFVRVKHYALFPHQAIRYVLKHANLGPHQVECVAIPRKKYNQFWNRAKLVAQNPNILFAQKRGHRVGTLRQELKKAGLSNVRVCAVEHHVAHMMSVRPMFAGDQMALLSFDGLGDFVSTAIGASVGNSVRVLERQCFPNSLGFFYTAMTQFLGFPYYGDEFKVMGLSSYGQPKQLSAMRKLVMEVEPFGFRLNSEAFPLAKDPFKLFIEDGQPKTSPLFNSSFVTHLVGVAPRKPSDPLRPEHWNLAQSVQVRFEEVANHLLKQLYARVPVETLGISGGCAHNSVWVGKILKNSNFKKVYVAPASHDAGLAVGAAAFVANSPIEVETDWGLLGPDPQEITEESGIWNDDFEQMEFKSEKKLIQWMVEELADGKIIGLCKGRMEFGPRALGSRSILADPRVAQMKDKLNARIKHRESFRPFAASVLKEYQRDWFVDSFHSPTMEAVFPVKETMRRKIPAVVHVDNSCRIQSVGKKAQPFFWELIEAFRKKTGIPMLVNTSFNDSEPIVCTQKDALECFMRCEMDHLVLEDSVITRRRAKLAAAG